MVMGIVRRGCLKSIEWHESTWRIGAFQALAQVNSRGANLPERSCAATGKLIGQPQDESAREWPDHPLEKRLAEV